MKRRHYLRTGAVTLAGMLLVAAPFQALAVEALPEAGTEESVRTEEDYTGDPSTFEEDFAGILPESGEEILDEQPPSGEEEPGSLPASEDEASGEV